MAGEDNSNKAPTVQVTPAPKRSNSEESSRSLKSPRTPRFAEATSVNSPIEPSESSRAPFHDISSMHHLAAQPQPSDVGFGYIGERASAQSMQLGRATEIPVTPRSPLKSALRSPGAPPRTITQNPLSPTWKQEESVEKTEEKTEKEQQRDLRIKIRVRVAKMALRFTNFSCSLIVLSMLASTFSIFNATRNLPARNALPPWASNTTKWPAILLLVISCVSLFMSVVVFYGYARGGHRRAEKAAVYYTVFSVGFFAFSIVMWGVGAAALQSTKNNAGGNDIWGWSCKDNPRKDIFQAEVNYDLVCRLQNWSLVCCLIEVVVEVITILIYGIVFYRFWSKRRLRKTMARRDTARSDLYLAQLRSQSAPNTPGLKSPLSPSMGGYNPMFSPRYAGQMNEKVPTTHTIDEVSAAEEGVRYITAPAQPQPQKPFTLSSPPPKRNTPKQQQNGFDSSASLHSTTASTEVVAPAPRSPAPLSPARVETPKPHVPAAPGEQTYAAVPIPGAYSSPINSPTHPPNTAMAATFQSLH